MKFDENKDVLPIVKQMLNKIGDRDIVGYGAGISMEGCPVIDDQYNIIGTYENGKIKYFENEEIT